MNGSRKSPQVHFAAWAAILLLPVATFASEEPVNEPGPNASAQEVENIVAPVSTILVEDEPILVDAPSLQATDIAPGAEHRGGKFTDARLGLPAAPITAGERAKLDMARAAIEASRAAGTLFLTELPDDTVPATEAELESMKMQRLAARQSTPPPADPIAGIGENLPSVQEIGPSGLSEYEQAKLRGENPAPMRQDDAASRDEQRVGDGAPSADENAPEAMKETSDE